MIKSVSIFGATNATGICVVNAAIDKGLRVRALVDRGTEKPKRWRGPVDVVEGDLMDIQVVKATLEGQNAAVVVLESADKQDTSITCEGLKNIVAVMESLNIKAISICFPTHTITQSTQTPNDFPVQDHCRMYKFLESTSLHWVAVVVPYVTDESATGYAVVRDRNSASARLTTVSRRDLAAFLVDCLSMPERYQKTVKIASYAKR